MKTYKIKLQLLENGTPIEGITIDIYLKKKQAIDHYFHLENIICDIDY